MNRTRYLVTYDISDDKRRTRVFTLLKGNGDHVQYSVFFCDLTKLELTRLRGEIETMVHNDEDQVMVVSMGPATSALDLSLECIGRGYCPPSRVMIV